MPAPMKNKNAIGNKGGGRTTSFKPEYINMAYNIALLGATDKDLADVFGVAETTINNWKNVHIEFFEALKKGKTVADSNVAARLYQRAMGFEHDTEEIKVVSNGSNGGSSIERVKVRKIYPPDTVAAIFWLKNRQRDKWRDKHEVSVAPIKVGRDLEDEIYESNNRLM